MDRNGADTLYHQYLSVALRKESVDRNTIRSSGQNTPNVALHKESVDRNIMTTWNIEKTVSRSPQGERG